MNNPKSKLQLIERQNGSSQFVISIPSAIAGSVGMEKGEHITWTLIDRYTFQLERPDAKVQDKQMLQREIREDARKATRARIEAGAPMPGDLYTGQKATRGPGKWNKRKD